MRVQLSLQPNPTITHYYVCTTRSCRRTSTKVDTASQPFTSSVVLCVTSFPQRELISIYIYNALCRQYFQFHVDNMAMPTDEIHRRFLTAAVRASCFTSVRHVVETGADVNQADRVRFSSRFYYLNTECTVYVCSEYEGGDLTNILLDKCKHLLIAEYKYTCMYRNGFVMQIKLTDFETK